MSASGKACSVLQVPADVAYRFREGGSLADARLRSAWRRKARALSRQEGTSQCALVAHDGGTLEVVQLEDGSR
jgi:hypothetical protein